MRPTLTCEPSSDRKSTRLNSSHLGISYAVFCLKKKIKTTHPTTYHKPIPSRPAFYAPTCAHGWRRCGDTTTLVSLPFGITPFLFGFFFLKSRAPPELPLFFPPPPSPV